MHVARCPADLLSRHRGKQSVVLGHQLLNLGEQLGYAEGLGDDSVLEEKLVRRLAR